MSIETAVSQLAGQGLVDGAKHRTPRKALHVLGSAELAWSGIGEIVLGLTTSLEPEKYRAECLFLHNGPLVERFRERGISSSVIEWKRGPYGALEFLRFLKRGRYDIVHAHNAGRSLQMAARFSDAHFILHIHGLGETADHPTPFRIVFAEEVLVVSQAVARVMHARSVTVVRPGVDTARFSNRGQSVERRDPVIGTLGRLVPVKGIASLLNAFREVYEQLPDARLEIAGDGPELDALQHRTQVLGLDAAVSFLGWADRPEDLFARWAVFAQPSVWDAAPGAVLQASASGLPVVASNVGGIPEMVQDGRTGYLVTPGDTAEFARVLLATLKNTAERKALGDAGRKWVEAEFTREEMIQKILSIYERAVA